MKTRRTALLALPIATLTVAPAVRAGNPQPAPGYAPQPAPAASGPNAVLTAIDTALTRQRYVRMGPPAQRVLAERGLASFQLIAQPGYCYTAFALGGEGARDVDLEVIDPSGSSVGEDRETDTHPTVLFCAQQAGVHLARVSMYAGAGPVSFGAYQGPPGTRGQLGPVWASLGSLTTAAPTALVPAVAPTSPDPVTARRIDAARTRLEQAGYRVFRGPNATMMTSGRVDRWPATLPGGACYAFLTFGGPGTSDTDIFLADSTGHDVASDGGSNIDGIVSDVCLPAGGSYVIRPRLFSGNGPVWFMAAMRSTTPSAPNAPAPVAPEMVTAPNGPTAPVASGPETPAAPVYRRFEHALGSLGWTADGPAHDGQLSTGADATVPLTLASGSCYAIALGVPPSVRGASLTLLDPHDQVVDRSEASSGSAAVRVCANASGAYHARISTPSGAGAYRLGALRWDGGTSGAGMQGLLFVRNAEMTRLLLADGYSGDADFDLFRGPVRPNGTIDRTLALRAGQCYSLLAVGAQGVSQLDLAVRQGSTVIAQDTEVSATPMVRFCAQRTGSYHAAIRATAGSGEVAFHVFRRGQATE